MPKALTINPQSFTGLGASGNTIDAYFQSFNAGKFERTSQLFAPEGMLFPPFEDPVQGPEAIAAYLQQEAEGMVAEPIAAEIASQTDSQTHVTVKGKVTALVFKVTVVWDFVLNHSHQIQSVKINLIASLEELLKIRPT